MPGRNTKNIKHQLDVASKKDKVAKKAKSNELVTVVPAEFQLLDRYWKASNYLSVG